MDIPRQQKASKKKLVYGGAAAAFTLIAVFAFAGLDPAAPAVERETVFTGVVERGTMLRQVRGPGTLVPEQIRWVPAVTAGRVEQKLVQPGTRVDSGTVLLVLSNPDVQLELLEAERQLAAARAQLVNLQTTLETQRLTQAVQVASVRTELLAARRDAQAAEELATRDLMSQSEVANARERALELETRFALEEERLRIVTGAVAPQLAVQREQVERLDRIVTFQRDRLRSMRVVAGSDGVLQDLPLEEGQWVLPGQTLARVVQPERLKAVLRIPETQARDVTVGQPVFVDTRTDSIRGRVIRIDPAVQNGAVNVDVALDGELPQGARPDLSVDGTIEIDRLEDVLYTGRPAFGQAGGTIALFRLSPDGETAERVRVRLGRGSVNAIEIVDGLREGDVVILSDMAQWDEADRIRLR